MTSLVNNLGGTAGFGEFSLARNDDGSTAFIDVRPIFGAQGINFFGHYYTGFYLNNNGSVTFNTATSSFTPTAITGSTSNPVIAAYWADIDTRGGAVTPSAGGTSTGSNLLWYDLDATTHTFTATWDDVGYYSSQTNKLNAFQISIHEINDQGDFDIIYRYENIDWTTGSASGGSNGLGGTPARAGYSAGNGTEYFELPQSGNVDALLALESASNVGTPGTFVFSVRNGVPTVGVTVGDASQAEGDGPGSGFVVVPVFLTEPSASTVTVHYSTANGTALAGQDYVAQSGTLTFAPGVTQQNILVAVTGDSVVEGDETFTVTLSDPSAGASILDDTATGTIVNDDASLSIAATSADKAEGQSGSTAFTFTVSRSGDLSGADSAQWAVSGAGVNGADFAGGVLPSGQVSFAAGESSKVITVNVAGDTQIEGNETFTVTLSDPGPGTAVGAASATGVIRNDDVAPASLSIAATSADKAEGQSGTTAFTFTVTRTDDLSGATSASWAVTGPAVNGADFTGGVLPSGQVSFAAGESSRVITIDVAGDTAVESNEAFSVTLSNPSAGAIIGTVSASGVIRNDDASLSIAATDADKAEGQSGTSAFTFTVTRTGDLSGGASSSWAVTGPAVNAADFSGGVLPTGVVNFAAGEASKIVTIDVAGDTTVEQNEAFTVTLSNPSAGAVLGTASANGAIRNDDASLSIAATSADKAEGQSGSSAFTFTVTRTGDLSGVASAQWAVTGAAVTGIDFAGGVLPTGLVSFATGEASKIITIDVAGDTTVEQNEAFTVTLSNPSAGAVLGTASANGLIHNDDASLSIAATSASKPEGQSGSTAFTFTVIRTGDTSSAVGAYWAVVGGAGVNGTDFTGGELPSGAVSFAAGETSKVITVNVAGDTLVEQNEAFTVALSAPSVGAVIGTVSAKGVIRNDDASLSIAATSADKTEGQSGSSAFTFTVTRTGDLTSAVSAQWVVGGAAVNGADFTGGVLPTGTVSFAADENSKVITIDVAGDTVVELNEAFSVTLSNPSAGAVIGTASANGVIHNDDASLSIAATSADKTEGQSGSSAFTFTVTRNGYLSGAASAQWAVTGAAVNGADFAGGALPTGLVSFATGEASKIITINVAGDTLIEPNEAFTVTLSAPSAGAVIGTASANGVIHNDDASLSIAATSASKPEGDTETTAFTFTVTRTGDLSGATSAHWAVTGAGVNGADFAGSELPSGTVSFATGESSKVITIDVAGDTLVEQNEAFTVALSDPSVGAVIGTALAKGVIRNDDASLSIAATSASKPEGQSESSPFTFTVTRTGDLSGATSAHWAVGGAAIDGADFAGGVLPTGTVSFAAGENSKVITIDVAGDTVVELNEAFTVALSDPSAGTVIGTASANGVIHNDDTSLSIAAISADKPEGDMGATAFTFTVTHAGDIDSPASVHWAVTGAAVIDSDFIPFDDLLGFADLLSVITSDISEFFPGFSFFGGEMPSGDISFAAGETSKTITVWALEETVVEGDESFLVTLSDASAGSVIDTSSAIGTIRNDDGADTLKSSVSDVLDPDLMNLVLTGSANINGTGNALDNHLFGNAGNNVLDGRAGADRMAGGAGNDTYQVDNTGDVVVEATGEGTDKVLSSVSFSLADQYIENLTLTGDANINGTGNALNNQLVGNAANNVLIGGAGNDILNGKAGNDVLTGGTGNDHFVFDTALNASNNVDTISDFNVANDTIRLENAIFTTLTTTGTLAASAFHTGAGAEAADDRIIYNSVTGDLFYDSNGNAAGGSVQFAHLSPALSLTALDFLIT